MSTKIHHGYRINLSPEQGSLFDVTSRLRDALMPVYKKLYGTSLALMATNFADAYLRGESLPMPDPRSRRKETGPSIPGPKALLDAAFLLDDFKIKIDQSRERDPLFDFQFEASFLSDSADRTQTYALIYTEREEYVEAWLSLPEVESFEYWDNTDEPEGMSREEWDERRDTWNRVLPNYTTPLEVGVLWSLLADSHEWFKFMADLETLAELMPSRTQRAQQIARRLANKKMDEAREIDASSISVSELFGIIASERPERDALTAKLAPEIEPTLIDLTPNDLRDLSALDTRKFVVKGDQTLGVTS